MTAKQSVEWGIGSEVDFEGVRRICEAVIRGRREELSFARVDFWSDYDSFPEEVTVARRKLARVGEEQHAEARRKGGRWVRWRTRKGPTYMAIRLDLQRDDHLEILKTFGPYSIHAEAFAAAEDQPLIVMHDSGTSVTFRWDADGLTQLAESARIPVKVLKRVLNR